MKRSDIILIKKYRGSKFYRGGFFLSIVYILLSIYLNFIIKNPNKMFEFEYAAVFFIIATYLFLKNRPDYVLNIYDDKVQVKYRKKDDNKDRIIYYKDMEEFFYMHKYVSIKEKNKDWFFIEDIVGFGACNDIQMLHKQYFFPIYKEKFDSGEDISFKYLKESAKDKKDFQNLEKEFILNREYIEIDEEKIYLEDIYETTYHPNDRKRHDPVDIAFLDESLEVIYIFEDRTISNYMIFHDLIEYSMLKSKTKK